MNLTSFMKLYVGAIIILPIEIADHLKDVLDALVRQRAFVTEPSFDRDGAVIKVVSKILRTTTHYPVGGVAESWVIHVNPDFGRKKRYEVNSMFYGDGRLATALRMYGVPFEYDNARVVTGDNSYSLVEPRQGKVPYNIKVVHGKISLNSSPPFTFRQPIDREWDVVQHVYSPKQLTELDIRQAEFTHRLLHRMQQIGNPTFGLGDLYIVDTATFKRRLHSLEGFGEEVKRLAHETLVEFEEVEAELNPKSL